jgi:hypothetical protein
MLEDGDLPRSGRPGHDQLSARVSRAAIITPP